MSRILVIDDDRDITILLQKFLSKHGYEVATAPSGAEGEKLIATFRPNLVLTDYRLDDMDGDELLVKIKQQHPGLPVIIITGYSDLRKAVHVMQLGAFDYVTKPLLPDEILMVISKALSPESNGTTTGTGTGGKHTRAGKGDGAYLMSTSPESKDLERHLSLVAPTNYSVIIYGESGVGKEGAARMIHDKSTRAGKPFIAMDCGAISKELAGSELFGHEQGAFTGAVTQRIGHFEKANGGTIFLDEVANLPFEVQTILLRVIQERTMRRIGGTKMIDIDVRIIVASNEVLIRSIEAGRFREDLYHRLNEFTVVVPPLRDRPADIMFFADYFLQQAADDLQRPLTAFDPMVADIFLKYAWPGNIRQLKNVVKRAALLSNGIVKADALPAEMLLAEHVQQPETVVALRKLKLTAEPGDGLDKAHLKSAGLEAEYNIIISALARSNFNKTKAAALLGIDRKTLFNKMKRMQLNEEHRD
jgi:two-component system response regulator HydG